MFFYRSDGPLVSRRARRVEEGAAHLVELLDELEPAQLEPALGMRDLKGVR